MSRLPYNWGYKEEGELKYRTDVKLKSTGQEGVFDGYDRFGLPIVVVSPEHKLVRTRRDNLLIAHRVKEYI